MVTAKMVTLEEAPDVRFGSKADIGPQLRDVRYTPVSDRIVDMPRGPLSAMRKQARNSLGPQIRLD